MTAASMASIGGSSGSDVVAVEARKVAETRGQPAAVARAEEQAVPAPAAQVTSLTLRRLAELPPDTRPVPTVDAYDQLLRHVRASKEGRP
jgi:hypothetical protein